MESEGGAGKAEREAPGGSPEGPAEEELDAAEPLRQQEGLWRSRAAV